MSHTRQPLLTIAGLLAGALGAVLLATFGTVVGALALPNDGLAGTTTAWFFAVHTSHTVSLIWFYLGLLLLIAGWVLLSPAARSGVLRPWVWWSALVAWGTPLVFGPPLFSRDLYSYVAQGMIARAGHNPSTTSPQILGTDPVLAGIASVWRTTPAPYGPVASMSTEATAHLGGSSLFTQVIAARLPAVVGMVLLLVFVPRLAKRLGVDQGLAVWLGVLSPLFIVSFFASGHNDALMLGIMVMAAVEIVAGRWWLGIALGTAAATVKAPALVVVVLPLAQRLWRDGTGRVRLVLGSLGVVVAVAVGLTLIGSFGFGWLSPSALSIPTELRTLATPSVALGTFLAATCHVVGLQVATHSVVTVVRVAITIVTIGVLVLLLVALRRYHWVRVSGVSLLVLALGSPTMWPWYLTWGLCLLAATGAQRSWGLALTAVLPVMLVGAQGTPALNGHSYLWVVPLLLLGVVWLLRSPRPLSLLGPRVD